MFNAAVKTPVPGGRSGGENLSLPVLKSQFAMLWLCGEDHAGI